LIARGCQVTLVAVLCFVRQQLRDSFLRLEPRREHPYKKLAPLKIHNFNTKANCCNTGLETVNFLLLFLASLNAFQIYSMISMLYLTFVWTKIVYPKTGSVHIQTDQNMTITLQNFFVGKTSIFPCVKA
jgi:hypothetical protein